MPLPDLMLGTRRLRRDIEAQSQQLACDMAQLRCASAQLRQTTIATVTSPLGLLSAVGIGFLAGRMTGRSSQPEHTDHRGHNHRHTFGDIAALALNTARTMGLQILLPIAAGWLQSKFSHDENDTTAANEPADLQ